MVSMLLFAAGALKIALLLSQHLGVQVRVAVQSMFFRLEICYSSTLWCCQSEQRSLRQGERVQEGGNNNHCRLFTLFEGHGWAG